VEDRLPNLAYVIIGVVAAVGLILLIVRLNRLYTDEFRVDKVQLVKLLNQWHGPADLISFPPPRPVGFTGQSKALLAVFGSIFAGLSVVILFVVMPRVELQKQHDALLSREGLLTQGTVTRTWITRNKDSRNYHVSYQYEVNGVTYRSEARVGSTMYSRLGPKSNLTLRYAPSQPEVSRLDGEFRQPPELIYLVVLPFAAMGVVPYLIFRQKKLLERGQPVGAIVTRVAPVKGGRSVSYQFMDFAGNIITGSATMRSSEAPAVGTTVTVIYDPEKSRRNMLYPAKFVRLRNPYRP